AGIKNRHFEDLTNASRNDFIKIARWIFSTPGIVIPINNRDSRFTNRGIAGQKNWSVIATPRFVSRDSMKCESIKGQTLQDSACFSFVRLVTNINMNRLGGEKRFHH